MRSQDELAHLEGFDVCGGSSRFITIIIRRASLPWREKTLPAPNRPAQRRPPAVAHQRSDSGHSGDPAIRSLILAGKKAGTADHPPEMSKTLAVW